jgi:hypothetical protein
MTLVIVPQRFALPSRVNLPSRQTVEENCGMYRLVEDFEVIALRLRLLNEVGRCGLTGKKNDFASRTIPQDADSSFYSAYTSHHNLGDENVGI